jgi:hypothetical protein
LAGAEGFEPSPSSLTVRCPTSWTTPQQGSRVEKGAHCKGFAEKRSRSIHIEYHGDVVRQEAAVRQIWKNLE